jgi:hypothetical protein
MFDFLLESRIDFIKKNTPEISTAHELGDSHETDPGKIVDDIAEKVDPTKNKIYTQWAVRKYHEGNFAQEDYPIIKDTLSDFHKVKHKMGDMGDINRHKDMSSLNTSMKPHLEEFEKENAAKGVASGRELLHDGGKIKVYDIKSPEAAQHFYGGGARIGGDHTDWCFAARSETGVSHFNHYTGLKKYGEELSDKITDPIHTIHIEGDNKSPYGIHSSQFQDRDNKAINSASLIKKHPELNDIPALKKFTDFKSIDDLRSSFEEYKGVPKDKPHPVKIARDFDVYSKKENDPTRIHDIIDSQISRGTTYNTRNILENPKLDDSHIQKIAKNISGPYNLDIVKHKNASLETKKYAFDNAHDYEQHGYTEDKKADPDILHHIATTSSSLHMMGTLMGHPNLKDETVKHISSISPWHEQQITRIRKEISSKGKKNAN